MPDAAGGDDRPVGRLDDLRADIEGTSASLLAELEAVVARHRIDLLRAVELRSVAMLPVASGEHHMELQSTGGRTVDHYSTGSWSPAVGNNPLCGDGRTLLTCQPGPQPMADVMGPVSSFASWQASRFSEHERQREEQSRIRGKMVQKASEEQKASRFSEHEQLRQEQSRTRRPKPGAGGEDAECASPQGLQGCFSRFRASIKRLVAWRGFEGFFAMLIISNTICVGIETEYVARTGTETVPPEFQVVTVLYAACFAVELGLRIFAQGLHFLTGNEVLWNVFDTGVVAMSVLDLALTYSVTEDANQPQQKLSHMRMVRIMRTARILRVLRIISIFRSLRLLLFSVMHTLRSLMWTILLLLIIMYMFGVIFTQAANQGYFSDDEVPGLRENFGTIPLSVYSLFMSITGGIDWHIVAQPLSDLSWIWLVFFIAYIAFSQFAVLNVVTGVFCQTAIEGAIRDQEEVMQVQEDTTKEFVSQLTELFQDTDVDQSGELTIDEFETLLKDERLKKYCASLDLTIDDAWSLFKLLDSDGSGAIGVHEFVTGCLRLRGSARSVDLALAAYQLKWMIGRITQFAEYSESQFKFLHAAIPTALSAKQPVVEGGSRARGTELRSLHGWNPKQWEAT